MFEERHYEELQGLISNNKNAQLIDLRSIVEFSQGSIQGAINMPAESIAYFADTMDPSRPVLLYDRDGQSAVKVKSLLESRGFKQVHNLGPYKKFNRSN